MSHASPILGAMTGWREGRNLPRLIFRLLLGRRLPITGGTLRVPGIEESILIRRDAWGVPHIDASTDGDAWYGLGFCHGQDRPFQLESLLRVIRGTVSELAGPAGLPIDRLARRIGFVRSAQEQLGTLDSEARAMAAAYVAGVNAGRTRGQRRLPHEFVLLRTQPTPWTEPDVLGILKLQSFALASNWDVELARLKVLREDGPEALEALDPAYPEWLPVAAPVGESAGPAIDVLSRDLALFSDAIGVGGGSNNWVAAGSRTKSGRPLLANDPHLGASVPPHWYLAHLWTREWAVAGASLVGAPGIIIGHNAVAAWGVTAGLTDNTDLFLEEVGPDGRSVRQGDTFLPCEVHVEQINVKGKPAVSETVLVTPRGPIISPAIEGHDEAIAMRATWLDPRPVGGLLECHRAQDFDSFRGSFDRWPGPPLNMVYADVSGTIAWQLVGEAPRRRKGHGMIPMRGSDPDAGWELDSVSFDDLPYAVDLPAGFVATANAQPVPNGDGGPFLGVDWVDGYRLARIDELLASRSDWTVANTLAMQMDVQSVPWREMRADVLGISTSSEDAKTAVEMLAGWDGKLGAESRAAAVYELFSAEMIGRIVRARAPRSASWALGRGFDPIVLLNTFQVRRAGQLVRLLRERPPNWFQRSWDEEIADALAGAVRRLKDLRGDDPEAWAWGQVRPLIFLHSLGVRKPLGRIFNLGPIPWGGDANTVSQAAVNLQQPSMSPGIIASLRMVVDVGAWGNSRFVLPGGQSGNPLSPHYADQLPLWIRGEGIPIPWSIGEVEQAMKQTLRLAPTSGVAQNG